MGRAAQRCRGTGLPECRGAGRRGVGVPGGRGAAVPECRGTVVPGDARVPASWGAWVPGVVDMAECAGAGVPWCWSAEVKGCRRAGCWRARVRGCRGAGVSDCRVPERRSAGQRESDGKENIPGLCLRTERLSRRGEAVLAPDCFCHELYISGRCFAGPETDCSEARDFGMFSGSWPACPLIGGAELAGSQCVAAAAWAVSGMRQL